MQVLFLKIEYTQKLSLILPLIHQPCNAPSPAATNELCMTCLWISQALSSKRHNPKGKPAKDKEPQALTLLPLNSQSLSANKVSKLQNRNYYSIMLIESLWLEYIAGHNNSISNSVQNMQCSKHACGSLCQDRIPHTGQLNQMCHSGLKQSDDVQYGSAKSKNTLKSELCTPRRKSCQQEVPQRQLPQRKDDQDHSF
jgi:hypothetical protein